MAEELGKIQKPEVGSVSGKRKLLAVPLIYYGESAPDEYLKLFNKYWEQVTKQLNGLEAKIGSINHVYHESIALAGKEGLAIIEKLNPACYQIVKHKCDRGAALEATEDKDMVEEAMDWERCLMAGFISQKVGKIVSEFYMEVATKRYEKIAEIIDQTIKDNEVGAIFIRDGHRVQFPKDIEVFSVSPPALDEIHRWQRDYMAKAQQDEAKAQEKEVAEKEKKSDK